MKFKTPYNMRDVVTPGEVFTQPSMTIPDQTMTIQEMLQRHAQGLGFNGQKVPFYEGDNDPLNGVNPKTLDLSELADLRDEALEREKTKRNKARKDEDARLEAARKAEIRKAAEELLKAPKEPENAGEQPA